MNFREIEQKLFQLVENLDQENFIYNLLLTYGFPKSSITRLKKGDSNKSSVTGELLYKDKIFYKIVSADKLFIEIDTLSKDERILKQNPRLILLTDFTTIVAKDLKKGINKDFPLSELPNHKDFFIPLTGAEVYKSSNDNKADREASYALARFYDIIVQDNPDLYKGDSHNLNILLSRLLFCFFAEDTGIFETENMFTDAVANNTNEDGSDLDSFLDILFLKLNSRKTDFPRYIKNFPYVNGGLFEKPIVLPKFSKKSREILIESGNLSWDEINPDIFGSMIQAVADPEERSDLGMHYTSVPNILKLVRPLFLDELEEELERNRDKPKNLEKLLLRISKIKFFDPACGSGNFLIIIYKELRLFEIKIIQQLIELESQKADEQLQAQSKMDFSGKNEGVSVPPVQQKLKFGGTQKKIYYSQIQLSQFYGIEIKDFAHEMAILSLWLAEHQMNKVFENQLEGYGQSNPILPLKESGKITHGNAAQIDWTKVCVRKENDEIYIVGNPPYLGARLQDAKQKLDIEFNFKNLKGSNNLDYIAIWFFKGAKYIKGFNVKLGFVSTNSICQGEQVSLFWPQILDNELEIDFAYQSFKWNNSAKGNAGVTVIIVGLRNISTKAKYLFNEKLHKEVKNINAYLLEGNNIYILSRTKPLSKLPEMSFGSMPNDGGFLLLNENEKKLLIDENKDSVKYLKKFVGASDFIRGNLNYCIWLEEDNLESALKIKGISDRIVQVKNNREQSTREATRKLSTVPFRFGEVRHEKSESIIIPRHSSENRDYIPLGFLDDASVIADSALAIYNAQPWLFGIVHSKIHMVWVNAVGGKLKTDYRYSAKLCYNTFPLPEIKEKDKHLISEYVFGVLDQRAKYPQKTIAWMYNPETMPIGLKHAHHELDLAIERIYRIAPFNTDAERLEFLFKMYEEMTRRDTLFAEIKKTKVKK